MAQLAYHANVACHGILISYRSLFVIFDPLAWPSNKISGAAMCIRFYRIVSSRALPIDYRLCGPTQIYAGAKAARG